jgi:nucleoside 2-deoxyribosyltransferase
MTKAYLAIGYAGRQHKRAEIETIESVLNRLGIKLFVFAGTYKFAPHEEKQMMLQAFTEIDAADMLIAEVSEKAIGVGIEIGYAVAKQKHVIYLRTDEAEHSTTAAGSSGHIIIYKNTAELANGLNSVMAGLSRKGAK